MDIFWKIAERKISAAIEDGEFRNLSGKGKPLVFEDDTWIPEDLRIAYKFLKNAGHVPPELELRNEIINLKRLIETIDDNKERLKKMRELNYKIMNLDILRKKPLNLKDVPEYESKLIERFVNE